MDSMTEMFYDETSAIMRDMRRCIRQESEDSAVDQEAIEELFRGVHTLKANSAMMLYEQMAELSKTLESLLYCFRGKGKKVKEPERFSDIVVSYLDFFEDETAKLTAGEAPNGDPGALMAQIREYTAQVTAKMDEGEKEKYRKDLESKPKKRQVFYIAGAAAEEPKEQKSAGEEKKRKKYMLSGQSRDQICQSSRELERIVGYLEYAKRQEGNVLVEQKQVENLQKVSTVLCAIREELTNTNFVPVARKMEIVTDEMADRLHKPVKLLVKGENTLVDVERREKISGALIHIIRNAIDHGIEDMETRDLMGKSPMGLIRLTFRLTDGVLKVSVKDDGRGIDTEKVLASAKSQGLLTKPASEYTEKEIYQLMCKSGVSTKEELTDYSGRGVGMDVISHNVKELGGKLHISSKKGEWTKITMKF